MRKGAVQIVNGSGNILATSYIYGIGVGPAITFSPSPTIQVAPDGNYHSSLGVAVDAKNDVFVSEEGGVYEILAVNGSIPASPTINAIGGGYDIPFGVAVDGAGNVFVADTFNNAVEEVLAVNGVIPPGATPVTIATLDKPYGIAVDRSGNIFISQQSEQLISEIPLVGGQYGNPVGLVGGSPAISLTVDGSGNLFFADPEHSKVEEVMAVNGVIPASPTINILGSGFNSPTSVAVDAAGNVYVFDGSNTVQEIMAVNGVIPATNPTIITLTSGFHDPVGLAVDGNGNLFAADQTLLDLINEIPRSQPPALSFASTNVGSTSSPQSITFQNIGNATLTGSGILSDTTDFTVVPGPGIVPDCTISTVSLAPAAECNLSIDFTPQSATTINATIALSDNSLNANPAASQTIQLSGTGTVVTPSPQTISFTIIPAQNAGTSLNLSTYASASSGLPVSFTSMTTGICTVSGGTATFIAAGTCTIQASQLGNTSYAAATPVSQSFLVHHVNQTVTFPAIGAQYAGTSITLAATASSSLPVTFASNTTTICTVSGNTATLLIAGYCDIQASQAGNAEYFAAMTGQKFLVQHAKQTIDFPTIAPQVAATQLTLEATASSGLPVTFASTTPAICTVSGNTATLLAAGYCHILATQAGNGAYFAVSTGQNFLVHHANQTITFSAIPGKEVGTIFNLTATTTSGLPVTFTSTTPTTCSVSGSTASLLNTGTCTIQASQAGNAAYFGAGTVTRSFTVR